jgi:hypothetical protein
MRISHDLWALAAPDQRALDALLQRAIAADAALALATAEGWSGSLLDATPHGLITHRTPERCVGRWEQWLPASVQSALRDGTLILWAVASPEHALDVIERAFEVARLSWTLDEDGTFATIRDIKTPHEELYPGQLSAQVLLKRAVYTGLTPGEAARLSAEEIVGTLLDVWRS